MARSMKRAALASFRGDFVYFGHRTYHVNPPCSVMSGLSFCSSHNYWMLTLKEGFYENWI